MLRMNYFKFVSSPVKEIEMKTQRWESLWQLTLSEVISSVPKF